MLVLASLLLAFAGPPLAVPWTCGVTKPCTQAHGTYSHVDNSLYAWDFDVDEGEEVWAASDGVVAFMRMDSTSGGCDAAYGSDANYVVVAHDDGTALMYMHLQGNSSPLAVGDSVRTGMLIGRVGLTGWVCGDHVHIAVIEQCGGPYCQSLPATFVDYGDPAEGASILSTNCPACTLVLDGGETLVSELEPGCFVRETPYWSSSMTGDDDHHFWTTSTQAETANSTGSWRFGVAVPGDYRVEVFVPDADAAASGAVYEVHHEGAVELVPIDQASAKGWQELGVFAFTGAADEHVRLGDNTGDAGEVAVAYDAVRFTFVPSAGESSDGGTTSEPPPGTSEAGDGGSADAGDGDDGSTSGTGGTAPAADSDDALPGTFGETDDGGGCACDAGRSGGSALAWLLLLTWPARRRARPT